MTLDLWSVILGSLAVVVGLVLSMGYVAWRDARGR